MGVSGVGDREAIRIASKSIPRPMTEPVRLAKRVAELRACSRREAEQLIAGGWVRVNGVVVEEPQFRVADQRVEIDPRPTSARPNPSPCCCTSRPAITRCRTATPDGQPASQLLDAASLWAEDRSGLRPLKKHFAQLTACVPLETGASGLVVFTQDWRIARKLTEDAATLEHEVVVEVAGELAPDGLKRLNRGIPYQGRTPPAIKVSWQNETRLRVALKGARPADRAPVRTPSACRCCR
jgi:23S rRNA pseudouridine2604 synthase